MIRKELISPRSIAVIGASEDVHKPGGALLANLLRSSFNGDIYVVNPKADTVQGIKSYHKAEDSSGCRSRILAIPAHLCEEAVRILCEDKHCGAIIIISAGFGENSAEGAQIEKNIIKIVRDHNASMIGPNCVGVMTPYYTGMFSQPVRSSTRWASTSFPLRSHHRLHTRSRNAARTQIRFCIFGGQQRRYRYRRYSRISRRDIRPRPEFPGKDAVSRKASRIRRNC